MKLIEVTKEPNPIIEHLSALGIKKSWYKITGGKVNPISGYKGIFSTNAGSFGGLTPLTKLGFEFVDEVKMTPKIQELYFNQVGLTSAKGFPKIATGGFEINLAWNNIKSIADCGFKKIDSLILSFNPMETVEGLPDGNIRLGDIETLKDSHKMIPHFKGTIDVGLEVKDSILGLCLIPGLTKVTGGLSNSPLSKSIAIINKYLGQGNSGMIKAQRELLENDLDDFAQT